MKRCIISSENFRFLELPLVQLILIECSVLNPFWRNLIGLED